MAAPGGLNTARIQQNVIEYWNEDPRMNWPVKVISTQRAPGATVGQVRYVRGCIVSAKFVLGRTLQTAEQILGLRPGDLAQGAVLLRLNRLPQPNEFTLTPGYTNVAAYPGYPPGLGSNQWILTEDIAATVMRVAAPGQSL